VEEKKETQSVPSSTGGGKPSLTMQQVSDAWSRVTKRTRHKNASTGAMLERCTIISVESADELVVVVIQTSSEALYKNMQQGNRTQHIEWALSLEFDQECRARLVPPGRSLSTSPVFDPVSSSATTMQTVAPQQSAYLEPPVSAPPAQVEQISTDARTQEPPSAPVNTVHTNEDSVSPVAKNGIVRENTSILSSRETIQQQAERDPVVKEVIRTFTARIVDVYPK
jgi:hypothetical protein